MRYYLARHTVSGERWAIQQDEDGNIRAVCGPLASSEIRHLSEYPSDCEYTAEDAAWMDGLLRDGLAVKETFEQYLATHGE